jgi:hypothetical protein
VAPFRTLSIIFTHGCMFSPHRLAFRPRLRNLPVNYARSERIVRRRYVYSHLSPLVAIALTFVLLVPWNQKVQGGGACEEGEVKIIILHGTSTYCMSYPFSSSYQRVSFLRRHECHSYPSTRTLRDMVDMLSDLRYINTMRQP